tara:strand:- start:50191 stop:50949 length:759 start_codon:yes stop_codon:yes gene_type:complete
MEKYVDIKKLKVKSIPKNIGKKMIEKYHYSHAWTSCRYALGLFYETGNDHAFFDEKEEKLIGVAVYGYPVGRLAAQSISSELENKNVLELTRLFIHDGYGKNIESSFISRTFEWLKTNDKSIKALLSYADPKEGHLGGIYQATNWVYQGDKIRYCDSWLLRLEEDGDWIHSRTIFAMYGTNNMEKLKDKIGHTFWLKEDPRKHRYVYFLGTKKEKKKFIKSLKHPSMDYPKNTGNNELKIKKVVVDNNSNIL